MYMLVENTKHTYKSPSIRGNPAQTESPQTQTHTQTQEHKHALGLHEPWSARNIQTSTHYLM